MRFSATAAISFAMVSLALALPLDATVAERNVIARDTFTVYSDTGSVDLDLTKRDVGEVSEVVDASEIEIDSEHSVAETESPVLVPRVTIGDAANGVAIVNGIINIATSVDKFVGGIIGADIKRRQQFTQRTISQLRQRFPTTNFVMSNVGYSFNGPMISRKQVFYHNHIGAKVSYDVIAFKHASFTLRGDGGFQNWAYLVDRSCKTGGGSIRC